MAAQPPSTHLLTLQHTYAQAFMQPKQKMVSKIPLYRQNYLLQRMNIEFEYVANYIFTEIKWFELLLQAAQKGISYIDVPIDRPYLLSNYKMPSEWVNIIDGIYANSASGPIPTPTNLVPYLQDFMKCRGFEGIIPSIARVYERFTSIQHEESSSRYIVRLSFITPHTQSSP